MSEKSKNILLGVLIVGLVSMTVAYAALSTTLTIGGTASVDNAKWDVHFESWAQTSNVDSLVAGQQNTASQVQAPTQTADKVTKIDGLQVSLKQPGDVIKYTFDIVNDGTIDAKLSSFTKHMTGVYTDTQAGNLSETDLQKFTYTITCDPSETDNTTPDYLDKATAEHHSSTCTLTVAWNEATNTPTAGTDQTYTQRPATLTLDATWVYVQK